MDDALPGFRIAAEVRSHGVTGVEMEALTAVSVAGLTLFDMLKAVDRTMEIGGIAVTAQDRRQIGELVIGFDEALALVAAAAKPLGAETVPLAEAKGRVLAAPVIAMVDSPPADVSAMDGYAVRDADLPGRLTVAGESFPGGGAGALAPGQCVRIFTGGPVPDGADRVVIQEDVARDGDVAIFGERRPARAISASAARDFARGRRAARRPARLLDARALVAAAGADLGELEVWRRPRLVILGTGDELAEPGHGARQAGRDPGERVAGRGGAGRGYGRRDRRRAGACATISRRWSRRRPRRSAAADLVVVTGGASVGEKDFAKAMFAPSGLELIFSKVAIKPGKPVWLGRVGDKLVMGLPGNPTSAMVTARLLLAPLVAGLGGRRAGPALAPGAAGRGDRPLRRPRDLRARRLGRRGRAALLQPGFGRAEDPGRRRHPDPPPRRRARRAGRRDGRDHRLLSKASARARSASSLMLKKGSKGSTGHATAS